MVGPIRNQDFNKYIETLGRQFMNLKQELGSQISSIRLLLITDTDEPLDDSKLSTLFIRLYRFGRYKHYQVKEMYYSNLPIFKEKLSNVDFSMFRNKRVVLTATCMVTAISTFAILSSDFVINTKVIAQPESMASEETEYSTSLEFPTLSVNGQQFATDAKLVSEQLSSYNFYNNGKKVVYLTFDDGPTKYTPEILNILKKYNIRGTFFTTGTALENGGEEANRVLRQSYAYGNSIGNHTYSHDYKTLYPNGILDLNTFNSDLDRNLMLLKSVLGDNFNTNIVRCPGGFNSWNNMSPLKEHLSATNKASIDWNALTGDSSIQKNSVKDMVEQAKLTSEDKNLVVLLMHETNKYTPEYLDEIIRYYHNEGYEFRTIA